MARIPWLNNVREVKYGNVNKTRLVRRLGRVLISSPQQQHINVHLLRVVVGRDPVKCL